MYKLFITAPSCSLLHLWITLKLVSWSSRVKLIQNRGSVLILSPWGTFYLQYIVRPQLVSTALKQKLLTEERTWPSVSPFPATSATAPNEPQLQVLDALIQSTNTVRAPYPKSAGFLSICKSNPSLSLLSDKYQYSKFCSAEILGLQMKSVQDRARIQVLYSSLGHIYLAISFLSVSLVAVVDKSLGLLVCFCVELL